MPRPLWIPHSLVRIPDIKTKLWHILYASCPTWRRMSPRSWPSPPRACPGRRRCSPEAPTPPPPLSPHVCLRQFSISKYFPSPFLFRKLFVCTVHHFFQKLFFYALFCWKLFVCTRILWEICVNGCTLAQTSIPTHNSHLYSKIKGKKCLSCPLYFLHWKLARVRGDLACQKETQRSSWYVYFMRSSFSKVTKSFHEVPADSFYENLLADTKLGI